MNLLLLPSSHICSLKFIHPIPPLFSSISTHASMPKIRPTDTNAAGEDPVSSVAQDRVPLVGVIQKGKPNSSSPIPKWGKVALLLFSAVERFSHGFEVFDFETLRTADPFIVGWFLSASFLGGYGEDGRGMNGLSKSCIAATKSCALGIPKRYTWREEHNDDIRCNFDAKASLNLSMTFSRIRKARGLNTVIVDDRPSSLYTDGSIPMSKRDQELITLDGKGGFHPAKVNGAIMGCIKKHFTKAVKTYREVPPSLKKYGSMSSEKCIYGKRRMRLIFDARLMQRHLASS